MKPRESLRKSAASYLKPGETIQAVIIAHTASLSRQMMLGTYAGDAYQGIIVTPDRILVLYLGKTPQSKPRHIVAQLPRSTRLGSPSGLSHCIQVDGEKLWVSPLFFDDIRAADKTIGGVTG